jgi:hypothetical protein
MTSLFSICTCIWGYSVAEQLYSAVKANIGSIIVNCIAIILCDESRVKEENRSVIENAQDGSGSDGAIEAVDVKNAGGTVIMQDPKTARYPSMPLALPSTIVDFEVPLEKIGQLLYDLLMGVSIPHKAFLINVTQFFRDSDAFAYLKDEVQTLKHYLEERIAKKGDNQSQEVSSEQELFLLNKIIQHISRMNQRIMEISGA